MLSPEKHVEGEAPLHRRLKTITNKMDRSRALKSVEKMKLPHDIQALVKSKSESSTAKFSEESMAKARAALNNLIEKAWVELDDKIIACKEYQVMNRATFDQVVTDIARLVEQITDLERIETESMEGIAKMEAEIKAVEEELTKETLIYNVNYAKNSEELTRRQNDLDVFQFILTFTTKARVT